jgi:multimeric flavodoxin WrbA
MKKILVLNGSPTPKGNTAALIDAFMKGAEEAGNKIHFPARPLQGKRQHAMFPRNG